MHPLLRGILKESYSVMSAHEANAWYSQRRFTFGITAKVNPGKGFRPRLKEVPAENRQPWRWMGVRSQA